MPDILFNFKDGEVISTHISGKIYNYAKVDQALEYAKKLVEEKCETKFSIQFDAGTIICIFVMSEFEYEPITFHTGHKFPPLL